MSRKFLWFFIVTLAAVAGGVVWWQMGGLGNEPYSEQLPVTSGDNSSPGSAVHDLPVEPAALEARKDLARRLKVAENSILILEVKEVSWPDACLGLPNEGEICAQVVTPGFWVVMKSGGDEYFYRTNRDGSIVRIDEGQEKG